MKIISWNLNGLRAAWGHGLPQFLEESKADIYAFQETKVQVPVKTVKTDGYYAYWSFCKGKRGYSGTLCLTKYLPLSVRYDMGEEDFDCEGRLIVLEYEKFYFVNCYVPNPQGAMARSDYREEWDKRFLRFIPALLYEKPVIICGDFNVALTDKDIYEENSRAHRESEGYLSVERERLRELLSLGFCDSFRRMNPDEIKFSWWSNRRYKREENRGWRIDYIFVSSALTPQIKSADLLTDIHGSDHCPVQLEIQISPPKDAVKPKARANRSLTLDGNIGFTELGFQDLAYAWDHYDWEKAETALAGMQASLVKAAFARSDELIVKWQKRIVCSMEAKMLAVRHTCSSASSAGIDGVRWKTSKEKMSAALSLTSKGYSAQPARLLLLTCRNGKQRRIQVETWYDRTMQTLYSYSLDPVSEAWADRKSFAFRKGRSSFDLNEYIKAAFTGDDAPEFAFIGDVTQCYEKISHKFIMKHIPMAKTVLWQFLKAGYVFGGELFPTESGIGVGCALSPIIANMVLDGMQEYVFSRLYPEGKIIDYAEGNLIRYADDILITARSEHGAREIWGIVYDFLEERGLELSYKKTHIADICEGFDFMSRHYVKKNGIICVTPSESSVNRFMENMKDTVQNHTGSQLGLIEKINRKIDGWATYHKTEDAEEAFRKLDVYIKALLLESCRKKHPKWDMNKILGKYWYKIADGVYRYALPEKREIYVKSLADALLVCHDKVKTNFNPYLDTAYLEAREEERQAHNVTGLYRSVWNRQEGLCYFCGRPILKDQERELIETDLTKHSKRERLSYIHTRCKCCNIENLNCDTFPSSPTEIMDLLEKLKNERRPQGQKFLPLSEYFRTAVKSPLTLKFTEIEKILGYKLGKSQGAKQYWLRTGFMNISQAWLENGYEIQNLHLDEKYIVFRKTDKTTAALNIPEVFLNGQIPVGAKFEMEKFFVYVKNKYGL